MATNLALDDSLVAEAKRLGDHRTKKDAVNAALELYVKRIKQLRIKTMFGQIDLDPDYNYKSGR